MPTPSEQKALAFFAIVILLGGAARVLRAGSVPEPTPPEREALEHQTRAVESAGRPAKRGRKPAVRVRAGYRRRNVVDTVAGVPDVPFSDVRPDRASSGSSEGWVNGFPPPLPRIDIDWRTSPSSSPSSPRRPALRDATVRSEKLDLDLASASELDERLPGVGPALAARLVANRDSFGAFGSLDALRRVKGIGPATLRRIAPRVTFSGRAASSSRRSGHDQ